MRRGSEVIQGYLHWRLLLLYFHIYLASEDTICLRILRFHIEKKKKKILHGELRLCSGLQRLTTSAAVLRQHQPTDDFKR